MMQGLVMVLQKYFLNSTFAITTNPNYRAVANSKESLDNTEQFTSE